MIKVFSALAKAGLRKIHDMKYNYDLNKLQERTFKQTGKELDKTIRQQKYVNGSKLYRTNLKNNEISLKQKYNRGNKLIDDIL